jgi:hypothetical protein
MALEIPTAEELFDPRPFQPASLEGADLSPAMEIAHRECARLIVNCCFFDPPITEKEIAAYATQFELPTRQAELEIRRERDED